jgi:hypothetical protein
MAQVPDLVPAQDAGKEAEIIGFDFGPIMSSGDFITSVTELSCTVVKGVDYNAASRWIGTTLLVPSTKTGAGNCQVNKLFQYAQAGVRYRLQCVVTTNQGLRLSLYTHISGQTPV